MNTGKRIIFFDILTGYVLANYARNRIDLMKTVDEIISNYKQLSELNRDSFDYIELGYDEYSQDFAECNGYRVNVETKTLEFSYPNPNEPDVPQPYQTPLSEKVSTLEQDNKMLNLQVSALTNQTEFLEEALTELILTVVP